MDARDEEKIVNALDGLIRRAKEAFKGFSPSVRDHELGVLGRDLLDRALEVARREDPDLPDDDWQEVRLEIEDTFARLFWDRTGSRLHAPEVSRPDDS